MASVSKGKTKKRQGLWLVGNTLDALTGSKLPSNKQVLCRFLHLHVREHQTIPVSAAKIAKEVIPFWERARILTRKECHVISKIRNLHSKWVNLKKNKSKKTDNQQRNEDTFKDTFNDLFDVAHADALSLTKLTEDKEFLLAQREKGRRGCMGPVDTKLSKLEERRRHRVLSIESRRKIEAERSDVNSSTMPATQENNCISSVDSESSDLESHEDITPVNTPSRKCVKGKIILSPELACALDRTKVSDRNATFVLAAAAQSFGHNISDIVLSKDSVGRARRGYRESISKEIRASFTPSTPLTVHWDGKMLPALTSKDKVDRLAVLVSGEGVMKLLGVPQIASGTGEAQANAVFSLIEQWNLIDRVQLMFSTRPPVTLV